MIQEMDLMEIFYWFHRHPELSYEEYDTTAQIKKLLKAADVKILPIPMETGLIAEVKGEKDGPNVRERCTPADTIFTSRRESGLRSGCRNIRASSVGQCGFSSSQEKSPPWAHG